MRSSSSLVHGIFVTCEDVGRCIALCGGLDVRVRFVEVCCAAGGGADQCAGGRRRARCTQG